MSRSLLIVAALAALAAPAASRADEWGDGYDVSVDLNVQGGVGFETFHGQLSPYGDWVAVGSYGQVWRPRVAAGWRPYYYGRWEWTHEGWFWVSDEPWGWAAYHYGRWAYDPYYGWVWVPGTEWAPAWVSWRVSGDVVGWAPLAPGFSAYVTTYPFVDFWWTFVPSGRFCSVPVHSVAYAPTHARRWYQSTAPAPAYVPRPGPGRGGGATPAWGGPAPRAIEAHLGRPLAPARIVGVQNPGARGRPGEIAVYRPERGLRERPVDAGAPAPAPGLAGRGGGRGAFAPDGHAPEHRAPGGGQAREYRGVAPAPRGPENRAPDAGRASPPRGGFAGAGQGGGAPGGGRALAPPAGGGDRGGSRGAWTPPAGGGGGHGAGRGGFAPPPSGGGDHGGGRTPPSGGGGGRGGGHGRGERN